MVAKYRPSKEKITEFMKLGAGGMKGVKSLSLT